MMTEYDSHPSHRQQDQHEPAQQHHQQLRSSTLERGRAVKLLRNGDSFFTGRGFVINQRKYPMLDVFLDDASQALRANFGAVRCIYTPKNGTRLHDISELEDHRTYVASGGERFKKLHYLDIAEGKRVQNKERTPPKFPPIRRFDVEGRALKLSRSENVIIYVYRNGDPLTLPAKILLVKPTLQNWESVLDEVTRKVSLTQSAVLKLYAMNGELITSAQQLEYNGMYVAAGKERYKRIDYPDPKSFSPNSSPKMSRKSYTKSDGTNTHTTTANSHGSNEHAGQRRPVREEYDFFNNKPQQHRRGPTKETDLDRDDGGIYKGRSNHRERAREVEETRHTKVDLPVDYREVETVEDENVYGDAGKTPRRHHQPPSQPKTELRRPSPPVRATKTPPKKKHDDDDDDDNNTKFAMNNDYQHRNNNGHHRDNNDQHRNTDDRHHADDDDDDHHRDKNAYQHNNDDHRRDDHHDNADHHQDDDDHHRNNKDHHIDNNDHHRKNNNGYDSDHHRRTPPAPVHHNDEINDDRDRGESPQSQQRTSSSTRSNTKAEHHAATVIQSHVRGYLTRKHTLQEREQPPDHLTNNHHEQQHPTDANERRNHDEDDDDNI